VFSPFGFFLDADVGGSTIGENLASIFARALVLFFLYLRPFYYGDAEGEGFYQEVESKSP